MIQKNLEKLLVGLEDETSAGAGLGGTGSPGLGLSGIWSKHKGAISKGVGGYLLLDMLSKLIRAPEAIGNRNLQREAIASQGRMATPEGLYYQAALPQAQAEEEQARQALFGQLSGGILGPSLARGETQIGG